MKFARSITLVTTASKFISVMYHIFSAKNIAWAFNLLWQTMLPPRGALEKLLVQKGALARKPVGNTGIDGKDG